jgi:hypothetical protein
MILTTTLNRLKAAGACKDRYRYLVTALGGPSFDHDAPINLLTILEHNGTDDCLWALQATEQNCDMVARLMACDFADAVLPIFEKRCLTDQRPRAAIGAARRFARGEINAEELAAAGDAAWDAARDARAAWYAWAAGAAWDAARAASWDAAGDAAWDAARAAGAARAAAWDAQSVIIRKYLEAGA